MELGIQVRNSRPYHPETMIKDDRFHWTFKDAIKPDCQNRLIEECQPNFDDWRAGYNTVRSHDALGMDVFETHYEPSDRSFPPTIHEWYYTDSETVRKVSSNGNISVQNRVHPVGRIRVCRKDIEVD